MKNVNDIQVNDPGVVSRDFDAVIRQLDIENAKQLLRDNGYFVDNFWQTCDVTLNYECSEEEAHQVLQGAFDNPATYDQIWDSIKYEAEYMNLKKRE
jgi:hypothetical protein